MDSWSDFLALAARLVLVATLGAALVLALFSRLLGRRRRSRRRREGSAIPRRAGAAELHGLIDRSRDRPYARDQLAERVRALARDAVALRRGSDDSSARAAIDGGALAGEPRLAPFFTEDQFGRADGDSRFPARLGEALDAIEELAEGSNGGVT
ncbi:MAG TPA: hypothetical protein VMC79_14355 [Rectinemataceae bacterium]|nr:hypothetical protein [Rectinemataceae bacterium]